MTSSLEADAVGGARFRLHRRERQRLPLERLAHRHPDGRAAASILVDAWYRPKAARVAATLKQELGVDATLVAGRPGEFTVWLDDTKVAEKSGARFPEPSEVLAAVRTARPPA